MTYQRVPSTSPTELDHDGKDEPDAFSSFRKSPKDLYKYLFCVTGIFWVITSISLAWVFVKQSHIYENHSVGPLPFKKIPSRIYTFNADSRFHYTASDKGEAAWLSLMPNDGGIVSISSPQNYGLPISYKNANDSTAEVYSMSMFHQLHCLNSIRIRLGILEGFIDAAQDSQHAKRNVFSGESHLEHCFDYLRQAIMCAGDLSLEHSVVPDEFGFNGWGTAHQCADWGMMWDVAVARRYEQVVEKHDTRDV